MLLDNKLESYNYKQGFTSGYIWLYLDMLLDNRLELYNYKQGFPSGYAPGQDIYTQGTGYNNTGNIVVTYGEKFVIFIVFWRFNKSETIASESTV